MGIIVLNSGRALGTLPKSSKHSNLGFHFGDDDVNDNDDDDDVATGAM